MGFLNGNISTLLQLVLLSLVVLSFSHVEARRFLQTVEDPHTEFAMVVTSASSETRYYGGSALLSLWNPNVSREGDFSTSSLTVQLSDKAFVEAGWMVNSKRYNNSDANLFVFWVKGQTGCFNLDCEGFVRQSQTSSLGHSIKSDSTLGVGDQSYVRITIGQDKTGNWVVLVGKEVIGYWPASLFSDMPSGAKGLIWGGSVFDSEGGSSHTETDMGNGLFPDVKTGHASAVCGLQYFDSSRQLHDFADPQMLGLLVTNPNCYDAKVLPLESTDNTLCFLYGGPGRNPQCP